MAKALRFQLGGTEFDAVPVKVERKKLYGWSEVVATDRTGAVCTTAYLSPDDALVIPSGALKQGTVDSQGRWVDKAALVACDADGNQLAVHPSSFDATIELGTTAADEEFLDHDWDSIYQLDNPALAAAIGDKIYRFPFSYRGGTSLGEAFLLASREGLFLFTGAPQEFPLVGLAEETVIDEDDDTQDDLDDLDFGMF